MSFDQNIRGEALAAGDKTGRLRHVTHDLANLLGVILGNADLALSDLAADHPAADCLREIQQAARDARAICREVRDSLKETFPERLTNFSVSKHFLLIDDDDAFRSLFERSLLRLGHKVSTFSSPVEALKVFQANPGGYDIVISDVNMPGANGFEVALKFLKGPGNVCVCLTSGDLSDSAVLEAKAAGIHHALLKPASLEEIAGVIQQLVKSTEQC